MEATNRGKKKKFETPWLLLYQTPVAVDPFDVALRKNNRLGHVGPGTDAKKRSIKANSEARDARTGTRGVKSIAQVMWYIQVPVYAHHPAVV